MVQDVVNVAYTGTFSSTIHIVYSCASAAIAAAATASLWAQCLEHSVNNISVFQLPLVRSINNSSMVQSIVNIAAL